MNNKKLIYILLALLAIWGLSQLFNRKQDRSFKSEIIKADTARIDKIILHPLTDQHKEIILEKKSGAWSVTQNGKTVPAEAGSAENLLRELPSIKVKSITTQNKDHWKDYEIDDSTASHVQAYASGKLITDFYTGKFSFNPQAQNMISFIRISGDPSVYAVDGFQSMTFNVNFANFRNKTISKADAGQINKVTIQSGSNAHQITKENNMWLIDGHAADSSLVQNYVNSLQNLSGSDILDQASVANPIHSIHIESSNAPIKIDVYPSGDTLKPFLIASTANAGVYFKEDSSNTYRTAIKGLNDLLKPAVTPSDKKGKKK